MKHSPLRLFAVIGLLAVSLRCGSSSKPPGGGGELGMTPPSGTDGPMINLPGSGGSASSSGGGSGIHLGNAGVSGMCAIMSCPPDGVPVATCGNALIETGEVCDDGNSRPGDGCSGLCREEANFACPTVGMACVSTVACGDGTVEGSEACDDRNMLAADGCDGSCQVENGFGCPTPGQPCTPVTQVVCGDGTPNAGETCDDGGTVPNDGCTSDCQLQPGYTCPQPGEQCVLDEYCGNGNLSDTEACDDGNPTPGDGCTGLCNREPFFDCPTPGMLCETTIVCGDSKVIGDEACDDSNSASPGCAADCKSIEPGYSCPTTAGLGGVCTPVLVARCGDSSLDFGEYCDDGNSNPSDGCTGVCEVTPGYTCAQPGQACSAIEWCGDSKLSLARGEQCDDGSKCDNGSKCSTDAACLNIGTGKCLPRGGDGCAATCVSEADFTCPQPGSPCVSTVVCGDGKVTGGETCDDKNLNSGDGCNSCQVEAGWTCLPGSVCLPTKCGDGIKVGFEQCDDGNGAPSDGCSSTCKLELPGPTEANGWKCPTVGQPCVRTNCGDAISEGSEQCDDGNNYSGDSCGPFCRREPVCPAAGGACTTPCGDGLLLPVDILAGQECDDGNKLSGDGCSSTCKEEAGYTCSGVAIAPSPLIYPVTYRDFKAFGQSGGHQDFENQCCYSSSTGSVKPLLHTDGKPLWNGDDDWITSATSFNAWYHDTSFSKVIHDTLTFTQVIPGVYQFEDPTFYPVDGKGWGNYQPYMSGLHNFHFTTELRYWFQYTGNEKLDFYGDDDMWVFINKKLAIDLTGVHPASDGSIILHANNGTGSLCDFTSPCPTRRTASFGLTIGQVYEVAIFQAERHTDGSGFKLTLSNFNIPRSTCTTTCGDGTVVGAEACDLGTAKNTGAYGTCNANCTLPASCGDKIVQTSSGEQCDDGINLATYGGATQKCGPGCKWAAYCGDAKIGSGEQCDLGVNNQAGAAYGGCTTSCTLGPSCGDGVVTNSEECDTGVLNGTSPSKCQVDCKLKCGNASIDAGEQCDDGKANNTGGYAKCTATCLLGPRCGDGVKQISEQCDDGKNDGSYGACAPLCVLGPRCGDATLQSTAGELCDNGAQNMSSVYGKNICSTACRPAPYCGNKAVDGGFGELCDDGKNDGSAGSCASDCKAAIPLVSCGNGVKEGIEQCDAGASNGSAQSTCDTRCRTKCGNGSVDSGEQCDDGVNNGSYGTCNANCTFAGYCGDAAKNGPEQCDLGDAQNQSNPYGANLCTKGCLNAPKCGDGRIQTDRGEQCDGAAGCSAQCLWPILR